MDRLDRLESKSIYAIREAYSRFRDIALLWSIGKDSTTLLWLCRKAFFGRIPFPVIHIDTSFKFPEIYRFRDEKAKEWGLRLLVARNEQALAEGLGPGKGRLDCCTRLKTIALRDFIRAQGLRALLLGIRRDEHGIRAKEGDNVAARSANMGWYAGLPFLEALDTLRTADPPTEKPMRFPVQDVYRVGDKRILAGRVESGVIRAGDQVTVWPGARRTTVKSIEVFLCDTREARAEESIGVTTADQLFIERGGVLSSGRPPRVADAFEARVFWMGKRPLADGEPLSLRLATQESPCRVHVRRRWTSSTLEDLGSGALEMNEVADATIRAERPMVLESFHDIPELGRFVLLRDDDVTAGGIVP